MSLKLGRTTIVWNSQLHSTSLIDRPICVRISNIREDVTVRKKLPLRSISFVFECGTSYREGDYEWAVGGCGGMSDGVLTSLKVAKKSNTLLR